MINSLLITVASLSTASAIPSITDYFPDTSAKKIIWKHAVNNKTLLEQALNDDTQMMEADVTYCSVLNLTNGKEAVMAHDTCKGNIDLTLKQFLQEIITNIGLKNLKKGVKLDFKDGESIKYAFKNIFNVDGFISKISFPLWINADILPGPQGDNDEKLINKRRETENIIKLNEIIDGMDFSLGWSTGFYSNLDSSNSYTKHQISEMKDFVKSTKNEVTFPVRAMYAANSLEEMKALLDVGTLTIWSAKQDTRFVKIPYLKELIAYDKNSTRIYIDVPADLRKLLEDY